MADEDCIFCKVLTGEIPAAMVDEDEHTVAFMDINPWTRGHALVIPRYAGDPLQLPTRPEPADPGELEKVAQELRDGD